MAVLEQLAEQLGVARMFFSEKMFLSGTSAGHRAKNLFKYSDGLRSNSGFHRSSFFTVQCSARILFPEFCIIIIMMVLHHHRFDDRIKKVMMTGRVFFFGSKHLFK